MSVKIANIGLIDAETLMVEFSDHSYAAFTVKELLTLQRSKTVTEAVEPENLPN